MHAGVMPPIAITIAVHSRHSNYSTSNSHAKTRNQRILMVQKGQTYSWKACCFWMECLFNVPQVSFEWFAVF